MAVPVHVSYRHMNPVPSLTERINELAERLTPHEPRIVQMRVVVDTPHHHRRGGREYGVRLEIAVPGEDLVFTRHPRLDVEDTQDVYHYVTELFHEAQVALVKRRQRWLSSRKRTRTADALAVEQLASWEGEDSGWDRPQVAG